MNGSDGLVSSLLSDHAEMTSTFCDTAAYFAPEIVRACHIATISIGGTFSILYEILRGL